MLVPDTKPHGGVTYGVMTPWLLIDNDDHNDSSEAKRGS
jgi:hypothetical protein